MLSQLLSREQSLGRRSNPGILLILLARMYLIDTGVSRVVNDHVMLLSTLKLFVPNKLVFVGGTQELVRLGTNRYIIKI